METLDKRLSALERQVYRQHSQEEKQGLKDGDCVGNLLDLAKSCGNALEGRDRILPLLRRTKELETYLDPSCPESLGVSTQVKANLILAQEQKIRKTHELLERVDEGKKVLSSEAFT